MDVVFDIDGTLANAQHRLHHIIPDPNVVYETPFKKDWDRFLSDELVAKDAPIPESWQLLTCLLLNRDRVIFITGRPESQRKITQNWLTDETCEIRSRSATMMRARAWPGNNLPIYMRKTGDRRPSEEVKFDLLEQARKDGYDPKMAFEDRRTDTAMWRKAGLVCFQIAEGNY